MFIEQHLSDFSLNNITVYWPLVFSILTAFIVWEAIKGVIILILVKVFKLKEKR